MSDLEREATPPPELKARVANSLKQRGLLRGRSVVPQLARIAAALVLFLGGYWAARATTSADQPAGSRWLLLLYEDSTFAPRTPISGLVAEYTAWADSLRRSDQLVAGAKLAMGPGTVVSEEFEPHPESSGELGGVEGLFIVTAASEQEALAIVRSMPHLRHGGRIVLRRIDRT